MARKFTDADEAIQSITEFAAQLKASRKLVADIAVGDTRPTIRAQFEGELDEAIEGLEWYAEALLDGKAAEAKAAKAAAKATPAATTQKSGQTQRAKPAGKGASNGNAARGTGGRVTAATATPSKASRKHAVEVPKS